MSVSNRIKKGLADKGITSRSIVAFVVFGMIVLVFVLSDLTGRHQGGTAMGAAAEVNGELISFKDFQDEENRMSQYYSQLFGGQINSELQRNAIRGEVMNSLVTKSVAAQAAEKEGIYATDAEIRHMIVQELPYFKKDGVFQSDIYKALLQANKMTPGEFEAKLRQDIKNQRSRQLFESAFTLSELQKNIEKELRESKINLSFISLSATEYAKAQPVSESEVQKALTQADFAKKVEDNYKANQSTYDKPEQVRALHILFKSASDKDDEARSKAESVLKKLSSESFEKLARQFSDDPGSKSKGGDLGYFSKGQMVKEFEEAAFGLPVGKTSGLVKSPFGYHIIKVLDKKAAFKSTFDSVKSQIASQLLSNKKYLEFTQDVEKKLAASQLEAAVAQLLAAKMSWKETGYFDISNEVAPVMNSSQAIKIAVGLNMSKPMANRLIREGESLYLIKLKDIKKSADTLPAKDQNVIERQKSMSAYQSWLDSFKKSAKIMINTQLTTAAE